MITRGTDAKRYKACSQKAKGCTIPKIMEKERSTAEKVPKPSIRFTFQMSMYTAMKIC